jgi:uncharacterized membrane protein
VIITIIVLEMKVPHGTDIEALLPVAGGPCVRAEPSHRHLPSNYHHMLHAIDHVTGGILWANLHLLFWLSPVPPATGRMSENHFAAVPTAPTAGAVRRASLLSFRSR